LKPFINHVIDDENLEYIAANNEGEAVAIAAGAYLAGRSPVVMLQNSGLGNAINPLASLNYIFRIPVLLIVTWRGEPGKPDAPQHELMGVITHRLLDTLKIKHDLFPESEDGITPAVEKAIESIGTSRRPYALIMRKGSVEPYDLHTDRSGPRWHSGRPPVDPNEGPPVLSRREALVTILETVGEEAFLIATTGMTGRELFALSDRSSHFYMVGSMGCASSLGLGAALCKPGTPIVVLDGDGAILMRMEAMVSIGRYRPSSLVHIVLDNGVHDSTGGQSTLSSGVNIPMIAAACGYESTASVVTTEALAKALKTAGAEPGPHLIHLKTKPGTTPGIDRPTMTMPDLAERFRTDLGRYRPEED
jgi:phosphonopyruvate decarboxylase